MSITIEHYTYLHNKTDPNSIEVEIYYRSLMYLVRYYQNASEITGIRDFCEDIIEPMIWFYQQKGNFEGNILDLVPYQDTLSTLKHLKDWLKEKEESLLLILAYLIDFGISPEDFLKIYTEYYRKNTRQFYNQARKLAERMIQLDMPMYPNYKH